jgi:YHS domain-containing protein
MKSAVRAALVLAVFLGRAGVGLAQHEGHQMGGSPTAQGACLPHAKESLRIVESANRRLEEARQMNSPRQMRAAMSDLQTALAEIRTQLALCTRPADGGGGTPGMEGMDHSGMQGSNPPAPEGMDDSKRGKEEPPVPKSEKTPSAQMDHSKMGQGVAPSARPASGSVDPVCGMEVGAEATEKATYQGKTYFFCSRADREKFLSDPEKYVHR